MRQDFLANVEILVLDFGSQYTQLIARRLREYGIYTEIVPYFETLDSIKAKQPKGIILSGGPASVYEEGAYKPDSRIFELGIPVLGICYGMQYIAHFFGGSVVRAEAQEFGKAVLEILNIEENLTFSEFDHKKMPKVALVDLWEDSVRDSHEFLTENAILEIKNDVNALLEKSKNTLVATDEETFLGFLGVEHNRIEMLFVHPKFFRRGVGRALLREAFMRHLKQFDSIVVDCNADNARGLKFYQKLGFKEIGRSAKDSQGRDFAIVHLEVSNAVLASALKSHNVLFHNVKQNSIVWMSHADKVESIPQGFVELAKSGNTHYCAIANLKQNIYALQFHPEVVHSECGGEILKNFALQICGADTSWNMRNFAQTEIIKLRKRVFGKSWDSKNAQKLGQKVLCAVSGGVDSSVVATLLYHAIGDALIPVFVDTGLLRKGEREAVEKMFKENLKVPLIVCDASVLFLERLKGVIDPEMKRKIIGETFIEVFEKEAKKHNAKGEIKFLAQGTLYPDVIESVSVKGPSKTIKSHHNVGGLPEWMQFELIEPLRELFKDEVRALGRELGMPESMLMRHPFPGPGLAIRIMGEVNRADLDLLREADSIFVEELYKAGLYDKVWQAFCVLLNVCSVGVMGDNRTYDNTICVRAVEALDGMTASFAHLPHSFLESVSNRIINEVEGINRVVYDITSKPPGTIEWE
ncbi:glutamine-hydrolyzing GMP synthase [Helicobacter himalayensis]|uniref:glutamine-hydrolyzing GMP synthase n=1 Tax=Helicobacter himalayensis TaxID=1591088 RepID=UPI0009EF020D|nr:glutamine-hydrolyzing GMP synthase [Helicobacter himalayensis]